MKRLVTLLLAAGLMFGASTSNAGAVELTAGGQWQFEFGWQDNSPIDGDNQDNFYAVQRIRPEFRFVADENLQAVLQLEIGNGNWGEKAWGMGGDATNAIKFRYGYVDWVVPGLDAKVRMGQQCLSLPQYATMAMVMGGTNDVAGVSVNYQIIDQLGVNLFWTRPLNNGTSKTHDSVDTLGLALNYKGDGFKVSPWGMVAMVGELADMTPKDNYGSNVKYLGYGLLPVNSVAALVSRPDSATAWWLGLGGELSLFDPFKVGLDFAYGSVDFGTDAAGYDIKRAGWMVSLLASYATDYVTPGIAAWYGSGDDDNPYDGSERLPSIFFDTNKLANWAFDAGYNGNKWSQTMTGTWGLQARLDNISFIDKLSHDLRFTYWQGTNDKEMAKFASANLYDKVYLTEEDNAWMVSLDSTYQIYKNLTAQLQLAYLRADFDDNVWGAKYADDDKMYQACVVMTYKF